MGEVQEAAARPHPDASPKKEERSESKPAGGKSTTKAEGK